MLNLSVIICGFVIILTLVFIIILDAWWELPISLFIIFHKALFLFLADKMSPSVVVLAGNLVRRLTLFWICGYHIW